jgi:Domain of unknown function (DUF4136)
LPDRWSLAALALATVVAIGASSVTAGVHVDRDDRVDFPSFRSYSWVEGTPARRAEFEAMIRGAVDSEFEARGLAQNDDTPGVYVVTHASLEGLPALDPDRFTYGGYPGDQWRPKGVNPYQPSLVVDLLDGESKQLIWRGIASASYSRDLEKIERKIRKVVGKLFRKYPSR